MDGNIGFPFEYYEMSRCSCAFTICEVSKTKLLVWVIPEYINIVHNHCHRHALSYCCVHLKKWWMVDDVQLSLCLLAVDIQLPGAIWTSLFILPPGCCLCRGKTKQNKKHWVCRTVDIDIAKRRRRPKPIRSDCQARGEAQPSAV